MAFKGVNDIESRPGERDIIQAHGLSCRLNYLFYAFVQPSLLNLIYFKLLVSSKYFQCLLRDLMCKCIMSFEQFGNRVHPL